MLHLVNHCVNTASGGAAVLHQRVSQKNESLNTAESPNTIRKLNNPGKQRYDCPDLQGRGARCETLNHLMEAFDFGS